MFKAVQSIIAKTWGVGGYASTAEWREKYVFIYTEKCYSVIKRYRMLTHYMGAEISKKTYL